MPFSPVPGPRLLMRARRRRRAARRSAQRARAGLPGTRCLLGPRHFLHAKPIGDALGEAGWLQRIGMQFHWENAGYARSTISSAALSSRKRKTIRRERRDANAAGLNS